MQMAESSFRERTMREGLVTALAVGGFLIIFGSVFGLTPGLTSKIGDLFRDFTTNSFPFAQGNIVLPSPAHPAQHMAVYNAVFNFMIGIGLLQIAILALRLWAHSRTRRIAETVGNTIFWLGSAVAAFMLLLSGTLVGWWQFWSSLIILAGVSLIAQFIVYLVTRGKSRA
jgi:hypothetical protein